jgi:AmmeMemoRadiSam system protein B
MAAPLPRLRADLDVMPSPLPEQPGLLVRDPFRYSDATLIVPPLLARCLSYFDGAHDQDELRARLASLTGTIAVADVAKQLVTALSEAGFLEDDRFASLREARERAFAAGDERVSAHAGSGYPDEPAALRARLDGYHDAAPGQSAKAARPKGDSRKATIGIAAPHVSPEGGYSSYAAAYRALPAAAGDRLFVVLGTSHYGEPDRFGLTRKPFSTPFGVAPTDRGVVDRLAAAAGAAVTLEDYCHAVEHSIEFQVVFLQHRYGPNVPIVPVLCGAFWDGPRDGRLPDSNERVKRFIGALGELAAREGRRLMFVLGVDFAHVGRRYGDTRPARAYEGALAEVQARDEARVTQIAAGDAEGFWALVNERGDDDLKWCGSSPLYTFLRAVPESRGRALAYEQWNIDAASVVSFGALAFSSAPAKRS